MPKVPVWEWGPRSKRHRVERREASWSSTGRPRSRKSVDHDVRRAALRSLFTGANTLPLLWEHFEHHDWARADIRSENEKG